MSWFFSRKKLQSVAIIDIRSSSISAGYVVVSPAVAPHIVHSVYMPLDTHATEPLDEAMVRTLTAILHMLSSQGSAKLLALTGSGSIDKVLVSVTSPWQNSRIQNIEKKSEKPFTFTKNMLREMTQRVFPETASRKRISELVITTFLNGYETTDPFGRSVETAQVLYLATDIDQHIYESLKTIVKETFHQSHIDIVAFLPALYEVMQSVYPNQRDYLVLDIGSTATDILLVKHGLIVDLTNSEHGVKDILEAVHASGLSGVSRALTQDSEVITPTHDTGFQSSTEVAKEAWVHNLAQDVRAVAQHEPLPRLLFLLSEENVSAFLKRLIDSPELRKLWLSDDALTIFSIVAGELASKITLEATSAPAVPLYFLALSANRQFAK